MDQHAKLGIYLFHGANPVDKIMETNIIVHCTNGAMLKINHAKAPKKIPRMEKITYFSGKSAQNPQKLKNKRTSHMIDIYI